jgi:hypothetical protein
LDFGFWILDSSVRCEIGKFAALFDLEDISGFYTAPAKCVRTSGHPSEARKMLDFAYPRSGTNRGHF